MCLIYYIILYLIMIKLFDFKFIILLALSLVMYFMYREIEHQKDRIQQCESNYRTLNESYLSLVNKI